MARFHSLLVRQLRRFVDDLDAAPQEWRDFVQAVDESYRQADADREMLERSLDLSSRELLEANAELRELVAELEIRNAEMERFNYTLSHDLRTPVFTIQGFAGMLRKDLEEGNDERLLADVGRIQNAATTIRQLLDELLELSQIGRVINRPEEVDLGQLAHEAADLLTDQIAEREARVEIASGLPAVIGDRARLLEVFVILLENAVKFMGPQIEPRIRVFARRDDGAAPAETVVCVADNGIGIAPRYHDKVFGLFDRLNPEIGGTGIGLAIVRRVVEVHGGRIWVESEGEARGSTFCFTLR